MLFNILLNSNGELDYFILLTLTFEEKDAVYKGIECPCHQKGRVPKDDFSPFPLVSKNSF